MATHQCFKNLKIKNQVLILQFVIFLTAAALSASVLVFNTIYMNSLLSDTIHNLLQKMEYQTLIVQSGSLIKQTNQFFFEGFSNLERLNTLLQLYLSTPDFALLEQPQKCPMINLTIDPTILKLPQFCYYIIGQDQLNPNELSKYLSLLNTLLLDVGKFIFQGYQFLASKNDSQFFAVNPPLQATSAYIPKQRPWYIDHVAHAVSTGESRAVSNPYQTFESNEVQVTLTRTMSYSGDSFDGVFGFDTNLETFNRLKRFPQLNVALLDKSGRLLSTNANFKIGNISSVVYQEYIYEESKTGFNEEDWVEIKQFAENNHAQSNCEPHHSSDFCRRNSLYSQDLFIQAFLILDKFYILVFVEINFIRETNQKQLEIQNILVSLATQYLTLLAVCAVAFIIITQIFMHFFLKPYEKLKQLLLLETKNDYLKLPLNVMRYNHSSCKKSIFRDAGIVSFAQKLIELKNSKSQECALVEKFRFPSNAVTVPEIVLLTKRLRDKTPKSPAAKVQRSKSMRLLRIEPSEDTQINALGFLQAILQLTIQ